MAFLSIRRYPVTSVGSQKEVKSKSGSLVQVLMPCRTPRLKPFYEDLLTKKLLKLA